MFRFPDLPPVLFRGGGDLATGAAWRLYRCGFPVAVLELPHPIVIRRTVAFANAIFEGEWTVEDVRAVRVREMPPLPCGYVPVMVDPEGDLLRGIRLPVLVDARMTKAVNDTRIDDALVVVGIGPGFDAGVNCHRVVESSRGHFLGRVYDHGRALPDTGTPGPVGGETERRVLRAPRDGAFDAAMRLGARVRRGEILGHVDGEAVKSPLAGTLRGLLSDGTRVWRGMKVADVDPREPSEIDLNTISDKARAIGGGVIEAIMSAWKETMADGVTY